MRAAQVLSECLDSSKRFDYEVPPREADPDFSTDYVWTKGPGRMLGVLVCLNTRTKQEVVLKAFRCVVGKGTVQPLVSFGQACREVRST